MSSSGPVFCPVCREFSKSLGPGPGGRPNASCINCGSLERNRVVLVLLEELLVRVPPGTLVVDVAPSGALARLVASRTDRYVSIDFDPAADGREVMVQASLTRMPFRDASVGLILCSHVLEHIPDDRAAMAEIARVLCDGGIAFIQVPRRRNTITEEDLGASPEVRTMRFGQSDHVRYYGSDFENLLRASGLSVTTLRFRDVLSDHILAMIGGIPEEEFWIARAVQFTHQNETFLGENLPTNHDVVATAAMRLGISNLLYQVESLTGQRDSARREAERWENDYLWLRSRLPVRVMAGIHTTISRRQPAKGSEDQSNDNCE